MNLLFAETLAQPYRSGQHSGGAQRHQEERAGHQAPKSGQHGCHQHELEAATLDPRTKILYLPMQLRYPCYQVSCADGQTCTAGECVPDAVEMTYSLVLIILASSGY